MRDFYNNLKRELSEMSSENIMITVSRKDLESLVKAYENSKEQIERYKEMEVELSTQIDLLREEIIK